MKWIKNLKLVIAIMMIIILTACISVYATYQYLARDVSYTKLDGTEISVQEALNELYGKQYKVECIDYRTENLINPHSLLQLEKTIEKDGTLIVDMAGVEGNNTLSAKWEHYLKVMSIPSICISFFWVDIIIINF